MTELINPLSYIADDYYNETELALALGITPQRLNNWRKKGFIPYAQADMIEKRTKGKVKASDIKQYAINVVRGRVVA